MTRDELLQQDVCDALGLFEDDLGTSTIGVAVKDGVVRLLGTVPTLEDREEAESVCRDVPNVSAVINDLRIERTTVP